MTRAEISTLARLDGYKLRALWRVAKRDRLFLIGSALLLSFVGFGAPYLFGGIAKDSQVSQALTALGAGALAFIAIAPQAGSRGVLELANGPFQPLVSTPLKLSVWLALRTVVLLLAAALLVGPLLALVDPLRALVFMALALAGMSAAAVAYLALGSGRSATVADVAPTRLVRRHPTNPILLLLNVSARRRFGLPVWLIVPALALFAVATAPLAARNNNEPGIGATLAAVAAVLAAISLFASPRLIQTLAREPMPLPRLYGWLFIVPIVAAGVIACAGSILSRTDARITAEVAASAAGGAAAIGLVYMLHTLTRAARTLPMSLAAEAYALNLFFTYMSLLWPLWAAMRLYLLVRAARRLRWLDR